ncbi:MAG: FecR domain-containing protein [Caulobacter sp.]
MRAAAAQWVVRLSDPARAPHERAAFEAWRAESFENEAAFEREQAAWERADRLRVFKPAVSRPDADLFAPADAPRRAFDRRSPWTMMAAAAAIAGVIGTGVLSATASTAYATDIGERRVVVLADNSRIELNTDSKVVVRYRGGVREVKLIKGEALFEAARDARPFVVKARDARIETAGGELTVRLGAENAAVTVRRGAAQIEPDGKGPAPEVKIAAGNAMVYGPHGRRAQSLSDADIDRALAWRQGAIALNGQSLTQAVAEFNRYNRRKVRISDPSIADLRLAGYFQSTEPQAFVTAVTSAFPVRASEGEDGVIRLARKG